MRKQYSFSAPPRGITGKQTTVDSAELKPRSTLYLPIKAKLPPEAERIKQEAEKILQSVREKAEAEYEARNAPKNDEDDEKEDEVKMQEKAKPKKKRARIAFGGEDDKDETLGIRIKRKTKKDESYENFKRIAPRTRPPLPEAFESPYLDEEKNKLIWDWMAKEETFNDFNYFLKICT